MACKCKAIIPYQIYLERITIMANKISISVAKHPRQNGIVSMRNITICERLLRLLLDKPHHLMVIAPGKDVQQLQINEVKEDSYERNEWPRLEPQRSR